MLVVLEFVGIVGKVFDMVCVVLCYVECFDLVVSMCMFWLLLLDVGEMVYLLVIC